MKKRGMAALMALLLLLSCTACAGKVNVVGKWSCPATVLGTQEGQEVTMYWEFGEKGSGKQYTQGLGGEQEIIMPFHYTLDGQTITIAMDERESTQTFTLSGGRKQLILSQEHRKIVLEKAE